MYGDLKLNQKALADGVKIVWQVKVNKGHSGVSIKGKRLYTMGNDGKNDFVYCLDTTNGSTLWMYQYACKNSEYPGPRATPTIDGASVYTVSSEGHVFAFDAESGRVLWAKHLARDFKAVSPTWGFAGSAVIEGDTLLLNANVSGISLNKKTGDLIWSSSSGRGGYATPVVFTLQGKKYVALFGEKALYGVDLATGAQVWSAPWVTNFDANVADPLVIGNKIFLSTGYETGCALFEMSPTALKEIWRNKNLSSHIASPVFLDGVIYGVSGNSGANAAFVGLDVASGNAVLKESLKFSNFIVVGIKFVFVSERGEILIAEIAQKSLKQLGSAKLKPAIYWAQAVYSAGRLYVRNGDGDLFCIDLS
jgi:outer membrane protein assembly factor BamB